jgi:hypothetical protein
MQELLIFFTIGVVFFLGVKIMNGLVFQEKPIGPEERAGGCDSCEIKWEYPDTNWNNDLKKGTVGIFLYCTICGAKRSDVDDHTKYQKPAGKEGDEYHGDLISYPIEGEIFLPSVDQKQTWYNYSCSFKKHSDWAGPFDASNDYLLIAGSHLSTYLNGRWFSATEPGEPHFCPGCGWRFTGDGWQRPISDLLLPTEVKRLLEEEGIGTVENIRDMTDEDLLGIYGIGSKSLDAIRKSVDEFAAEAQYIECMGR